MCLYALINDGTRMGRVSLTLVYQSRALKRNRRVSFDLKFILPAGSRFRLYAGPIFPPRPSHSKRCRAVICRRYVPFRSCLHGCVEPDTASIPLAHPFRWSGACPCYVRPRYLPSMPQTFNARRDLPDICIVRDNKPSHLRPITAVVSYRCFRFRQRGFGNPLLPFPKEELCCH